jgi:hypothetical protein
MLGLGARAVSGPAGEGEDHAMTRCSRGGAILSGGPGRHITHDGENGATDVFAPPVTG